MIIIILFRALHNLLERQASPTQPFSDLFALTIIRWIDAQIMTFSSAARQYETPPETYKHNVFNK